MKSSEELERENAALRKRLSRLSEASLLITEFNPTYIFNEPRGGKAWNWTSAGRTNLRTTP